jgi:predicted esterase
MRVLAASCLALSLQGLGPVVRAQPAQSTATESRWCAPEFEVVGSEICHAAPPTRDRSPDTLVVFLHGVIQPDTEWQWAQQRAMARAALKLGVEVLMPRGRRGIGPRGMEDWWTWPTGVRARRAVEDQLVGEWQEAQRRLEGQRSAAFRRVVLMGFSNGAYYAASLALRGRLRVDGYALFAGGGAAHLEKQARKIRLRPPIYVGYGGRDHMGKRDARAFGAVLRRLGWRHKFAGSPSAGHSMPDAQVRQALEFLTKSSIKRPAIVK